MTIEERLKQYILTKYHSVLEFSQKIGLPYTTLSTIFKRGIFNSSVTNIIKICKGLGISTDELAEGRITPVEDVPEEISIDLFLIQLEQSEMLLDGQLMTAEEKRTLIDAFNIGIEMIRKKR